ncbi:MAG: tryptophan synthase subunit alpha [Bacteroidetes bacterium]|nr:MAG: tryptophan synthase subunit alpha [Bacteroidota bacterium]
MSPIENRINKLFVEKNRRILSIYFTAGYPKLDTTAEIISELEEVGVDLIEIGMPFSDPLADGPTIQDSSQVALNNGMSITLLFDQLKEIRNSIQIPLILMGYLNPILQYGIQDFCEKCSVIGIDGLIIPDMPLDFYTNDYKDIFEKHDLKNILLITPQTSEERIREIDSNSNGFIYAVSSYSITGAKTGISEEQIEYLNRIRSYNLKNPIVVGFGISDKESFTKVTEHADGAVIGSAFIKAISNGEDLPSAIKNFISSIKN